MSFKFSHLGTEIETKFQLTDEQDDALRKLINETIKDVKPVTLSGYSGSGKSFLISNLEVFLKEHYKSDRYHFIYAAPTHAATVYLGLNIKKLPFTLSSIIMKKYVGNGKFKPKLSSKFENALYGDHNVLVIDESSMISQEDLHNLVKLTDKSNIKIIFLGDKAQLPEVSESGKYKNISDIFTSFKQITLTKVQRTHDDSILRVLSYIRENSDGYLPVIPNTETLKYYTYDQEYYKTFLDVYKEEPEDTVFLSYTNNVVQRFNIAVRQSLYPNSDGIIAGESIVGFGGYNNKQVFAGNLANSVKYKIIDFRLEGSVMKLWGFSNKACQIEFDLGQMETEYYQLSNQDSINLRSLTEKDFEKNNKVISSIFRSIYHSKLSAIHNPRNWYNFFETLFQEASPLRTMELGNDYIFNPESDKMELFDSKKHTKLKKEFPELYMGKGIDYGYAITIHKSQGSTYKNVFFDAVSTENERTPIVENGRQIGTIGNSLNYVGMSRASDTLHVRRGNKIVSI